MSAWPSRARCWPSAGGLWGTVCAWLRIPRLLSVPVALIIALALAAIEALLWVRERTAWHPE
jgi:hypothetical protein